jgi:alpha-tubulin suppressor-like RCC1 family protein
VPGVANVTDVTAGRDHCLAVSANGSVWAWGRNGLGQLGNGNVAKHPSPVRVKTKAGGTNVVLSSIVSVGAGADHSLAVAGMAGGRQSSLAVTVTGAVYTWGDGRDGQLGDGSTTSSGRTAPGIVPGLTADAVAMGRDFAFAIVPAG